MALLPWRVGFAVLKALARRSWGFTHEADAAWNVAAAHAGLLDEHAWKYRYRLLRWVERADTYLTLLHGTSWWARRVRVRGEFPAAAPACVMLTFHWGAGHWVWKLLRARGIRAYFLARKPLVQDFGHARVSAWYASLRGWGLKRIGSLGPLYTGGSGTRVLEALGRGDSIVAMLDLPSSGDRASETVELLDRAVNLPSGVARLAESARAPLAVFSCRLLDDGTRELWIEPLDAMSAAETMQRYACRLDALLREAPEAWLIWHEAVAAFAPRT